MELQNAKLSVSVRIVVVTQHQRQGLARSQDDKREGMGISGCKNGTRKVTQKGLDFKDHLI